MKLKTVIDKNEQERVEIYAHQRNALVDAIEKLVDGTQTDLIGYLDDQGVILTPDKVSCFVSEDDKTYALVGNEKLRVKLRLYALEERYSAGFIRINQSALANLAHIERFDTSISGTILVKFKNGHRDFVSRRNLKQVKERLGI